MLFLTSHSIFKILSLLREPKKQILWEKNNIVLLFTSHGTGLAPKTWKKLGSVKNETPYCLFYWPSRDILRATSAQSPSSYFRQAKTQRPTQSCHNRCRLPGNFGERRPVVSQSLTGICHPGKPVISRPLRALRLRWGQGRGKCGSPEVHAEQGDMYEPQRATITPPPPPGC